MDNSFDGDFPQASFDAVSVPFVELIEGATTEPSDGGAIAGKGLIELIGALPLLAQEADALATTPPPPPRRPTGKLAETEWSDRDRRGQETTTGAIVARMRVTALFAVLVLIVGVLAGMVARLVRRVRGGTREGRPPSPARRRRRGRRRTRKGGRRR